MDAVKVEERTDMPATVTSTKEIGLITPSTNSERVTTKDRANTTGTGKTVDATEKAYSLIPTVTHSPAGGDSATKRVLVPIFSRRPG